MATYGYIRVSTAEQAEDDRSSLDGQRRKVSGLAMAADLELTEVFEDRGVSGSVPLSERPAGSAMWSRLVSGDSVIVAKLDRLFRSAADALATAEEMRERGIDLYILDMGTEPVTANGSSKMFFGMLALVAEFERDRIRERLSDGRKGKRAKGGHIGGTAPFGYRVEGSGREARLVPVEAEQAAIRRMQSMRAEGASYRAISDALKAEGHNVSHVTVKRIVSESAA